MTQPEQQPSRISRLSNDALTRATALLDQHLADAGVTRPSSRDQAIARLGVRVGILAAFSVFEEVFDQMLWTLELSDPTSD